MPITNPLPVGKVKGVSGISVEQESMIKAFLQGAVYCWNKNVTDKKIIVFAAHDLVGGVNKDWEKTPLRILFDKHMKRLGDAKKAEKAAGKDLGWILYAVLNEDMRDYEKCSKGLVTGYRWVIGEMTKR